MLNKEEFLRLMASSQDISYEASKRTLKRMLNTLELAMLEHGGVKLVGFGNFAVVDRKERNGHNPRTGEALRITARKDCKFRLGKNIKEKLNSM